MPQLDSKVAQLVDNADYNSDEEDDLIAALEENDDLDAFRERRIQQLHEEFSRAKAQKSQGFGHYSEIKDEKEVMDLTTSVKYAVVHFAKDDFQRCRVMDGHLEALAKKHFDTRFIKVNVDNAPFLVVKLKVQVLPCVLCFIDGVGVDRIVGFEGLSYTQDTFKTPDLEARLLSSGVVQRAKQQGDAGVKWGVKKQEKEDSDHDDWD